MASEPRQVGPSYWSDRTGFDQVIEDRDRLVIEVSERAEAALKTNAEAYRLAQEALDMRAERDSARAALREIAEQTIVYVAGTHEPTYEIALRMQAIASAALDA